MSNKSEYVGNGSDAKDYSAVPLTEAAVKASDPRTLPDGHSEFVRMGDLRRLFGLTRATAYLLAKHGLIKTIALRQRGHVRGVRLVSVPSVRTYLHGLLENQAGEVKTAHD